MRRNTSRVARIGRIWLWAACLAVLAIYGALIESGHWGSDEYFVGWVEHRSGFDAWSSRVLHWSPRPVAELTTALYLWLARLAGHALVVPLLAIGWAGTILLVGIVGGRSGARRPWLLSVLLFSAMLTIGRPDEFFFWPMATIAYLTAWAALAAATLRLHTPERAGVLLAALLTIAALSTEIAAAIVLLAAPVMLALAVFRARGRRPDLREIAAWSVPLAASLLVCLLVHEGRMAGTGEIMDPASGLARHWLPDLRAAMRPFLGELFGVDAMAPRPALVLKLAVLAMLPPLIPSLRPGGRWRLAIWTASLLIGAYASIVLALHQFGTVCCVRHATFREGLYLLAALGVVSLLPFRVPGAVRWPVLATAVCVLLAVRAPSLRVDLGLLPAQTGARQASWASGRAPGPAMRFVVPPSGLLTGGASWPAGTVCVPTDRLPAYGQEAMASFFGKRQMTVLPWDRRRQAGTAEGQGLCP